MIDLSVTGLDELIAALEALPARIDQGIDAYLLQRAESAMLRFAGCTPIDTGAAAAGWVVDDQRGPLEVAITNPVTSNRGFPYPSALLTGTGQRGAGATPALGYHGGFSATPGMFPAAQLQAAWNDEASQSLATPELLTEIHA